MLALDVRGDAQPVPLINTVFAFTMRGTGEGGSTADYVRDATWATRRCSPLWQACRPALRAAAHCSAQTFHAEGPPAERCDPGPVPLGGGGDDAHARFISRSARSRTCRPEGSHPSLLLAGVSRAARKQQKKAKRESAPRAAVARSTWPGINKGVRRALRNEDIVWELSSPGEKAGGRIITRVTRGKGSPEGVRSVGGRVRPPSRQQRDPPGALFLRGVPPPRG